MVRLGEARLFVPQVVDPSDSILRSRCQPEVEIDLLHLARALHDAAVPFASAPLGALGTCPLVIFHGRKV